MPVLFLAVGVAGVALALVGFFSSAYALVAVGIAMILGAFFLFSRTNQGTPAPAKGDDSLPAR